jgi:hypothetical protein
MQGRGTGQGPREADPIGNRCWFVLFYLRRVLPVLNLDVQANLETTIRLLAA